MQHMIMHHAQAVEMTALIESHTENKELRSLGRAHQQVAIRRNKLHETLVDDQRRADFAARCTHMPGMDMSSHQMLMPGMLTPKQMDALRKAKGEEFDELFLRG